MQFNVDDKRNQLLRHLYNRHVGMSNQTHIDFFIQNNWRDIEAKNIISDLITNGRLINVSANWRQLGNISGGIKYSFDNLPLTMNLTNDGIQYCQSMSIADLQKRVESRSTSSTMKKNDSQLSIFLSYITKKKKYAGKIKEILEDYGFSCFLAHEDIHPTHIWLDTILENLDQCDVFVPILTKDFNLSVWVGQEIGYALAKGKHIVPLKIGIDPPGFIGRYQALSYKLSGTSFPLGRFLNAISTNPNFSERIRKQIIQQFCESRSFIDARDNAEILIALTDITKEELKVIMEASIANDQIYRMPTACRNLVAFVRKYDLSQIPSEVVKNFNKMIGRI